MKNTFILISIAGLVAFAGCRNPCKGFVEYTKTDTRLLNYFFKVGSYWVYQDSATGAIDSQFVFNYTYSVHLLDSASLCTAPSSLPAHYCCGPTYYDILTMSVIDFKNGVIDSFQYTGGNGGIGLESFNPNVTLNNDVVFLLNPGNPPGPWTRYRLYYLGQLNSLIQNGITYSSIAVFQTRYNAQYTYYFTCTTDLYFCSGYGIIKKVEHASTGDIVWQLTRFNLL